MRRLSALVVGLIVAGICARLGVWQIDRLTQRRALNATVEARLAATSLGVPGTALPDTLDFRRARVRGTWDFARQIILPGRTLDGALGASIVTPLILPTGAVLVERGWVYAVDGRTVTLDQFREPDPEVIDGVFLPGSTVRSGLAGSAASISWPLMLRAVNIAELGRAYPYRLVPSTLRRTSDPPSDLRGRLRLVPVPERGNGPHLSYAIQWFAFAVIAAVGSVILVLKTPAARVELKARR